MPKAAIPTVIEFFVKNVYGKELMYVKDEKLAQSLFQLTGHRTLTDDAKKAMESIGFTFEQVLP